MALGRRLDPEVLRGDTSVVRLIDDFFFAYNAARLREAARLFVEKCTEPDVTVGVTLSGALTPTGLGTAAIVPLMEAGLIDWMISTGANLYHDLHRSLGFSLYQTSPFVDDVQLRDEGIIRIYDIVFDQEVLLKSDAFLRRVLEGPEFQGRLSTAEMHYYLGKYVHELEKRRNIPYRSVLGAAYELGVPIYTSSPGDSTLGMNVAALRLAGHDIGFDPEADVNETTAIVYDAKSRGGRSAVVIFGGGSPKNFALQTEPQIQEIMGIDEKGHDYFIQITDARPDTGGLSGATPAEAVTWGKVDPEQLPDTVVCYTDSTIAMPLIAAYALAKREPRPLKRLYDRRREMVQHLADTYREHRPVDADDLLEQGYEGGVVSRGVWQDEES
ncbi:MAG: deoxyhypusine synthase [Chloroflexota bacterium]|nr:deoxyhypusine synthase [Chloroflexota bacterium]